MSGVDLVTFLRARLDEDERVARAAIGGPWEVGPTFGARDNRVYVRAEGDLIDSVGTCVIAGQIPNVPEWRGNAQHIARHDPARVLRDVAAKRRIVDWAMALLETLPNDPAAALMFQQAGDELLRQLAAPFAQHPDYDPAWSVEA